MMRSPLRVKKPVPREPALPREPIPREADKKSKRGRPRNQVPTPSAVVEDDSSGDDDDTSSESTTSSSELKKRRRVSSRLNPTKQVETDQKRMSARLVHGGGGVLDSEKVSRQKN
jgi:hypothetical protein